MQLDLIRRQADPDRSALTPKNLSLKLLYTFTCRTGEEIILLFLNERTRAHFLAPSAKALWHPQVKTHFNLLPGLHPYTMFWLAWNVLICVCLHTVSASPPVYLSSTHTYPFSYNSQSKSICLAFKFPSSLPFAFLLSSSVTESYSCIKGRAMSKPPSINKA